MFSKSWLKLFICSKYLHLLVFCWFILKETCYFFSVCVFFLFYSSSLLVPCPSRWALCRPSPRTKFSDERTVTMITWERCLAHPLMTGQRWFTRSRSSLGWTVIRWSAISCVNCTPLALITLQKRYWMICWSKLNKHFCYTSQLKYVFRLEENVSRVVGQKTLTL